MRSPPSWGRANHERALLAPFPGPKMSAILQQRHYCSKLYIYLRDLSTQAECVWPMFTRPLEVWIRHAQQQACFGRSRIHERSVVCIVNSEERAKVARKWDLCEGQLRTARDIQSQHTGRNRSRSHHTAMLVAAGDDPKMSMGSLSTTHSHIDHR